VCPQRAHTAHTCTAHTLPHSHTTHHTPNTPHTHYTANALTPHTWAHCLNGCFALVRQVLSFPHTTSAAPLCCFHYFEGFSFFFGSHDTSLSDIYEAGQEGYQVTLPSAILQDHHLLYSATMLQQCPPAPSTGAGLTWFSAHVQAAGRFVGLPPSPYCFIVDSWALMWSFLLPQSVGRSHACFLQDQCQCRALNR